MGKQATSHARRFVAREGHYAMRAGPSCSLPWTSRSDRALGQYHFNPGVQFSMSERGPVLDVD